MSRRMFASLQSGARSSTATCLLWLGRLMSKYRAKKAVVDGLKFDSQREAARYGELRLMERAGQIRGLERQVPYELAPPVKYEGAARAKPALRIVVDFRYWEQDTMVLEDLKGMVTREFEIKRHLLKAVHKLDVRVTK